jgi:uncharacterized repeat protein (TIGR01451 family)
MNLRLPLFALLIAAHGAAARAQFPAMPPGRAPAPLLFVRFAGPAGLRATFFQGRAAPRTHATPVVVGLRPGYIYRVQLSGIPGHPNLRLYPSLEVQGSLCLPPRIVAANFPVPLNITEADLQAALAGSLVTKVLYLEDPDRAEPTATHPDDPLEVDRPPTRDLYAEARSRGRVMLVFRLGDGLPSAEDLAVYSVSGTILQPGEKSLSRPNVPPYIAWSAWQYGSPVCGARLPEEECLHDGGDRGERAAIAPDGRLYGLDPEDTVAEFTNSRGRRDVTCSNRVCLCVPRFAALRSELPPGSYDAVVGLADAKLVKAQRQVEVSVPSEQARLAERLRAYAGRVRPSVNVNVKAPAELVSIEVLQGQEVYLGLAELIATNRARTLTAEQRALLVRQVEFAREMSTASRVRGTEQVIRTAVVGRVEGGPQVITAEVAPRDLTVCCNEVPCPPDKPLILVKCADRHAAKVGDVVTFSLRYSNHGGRPITDIAVSDSLSGRLEYVPGSAESDRDAVFTVQENEAGSAILRWEISGRLLPGDSGRLRFKARVR